MTPELQKLVSERSRTLAEPTKRGRPRKHKNDAEKQDAYRRRRQDQERQTLVEAIVWKTPIRPGERIDVIEQELGKLSLRKLKEKLNGGITPATLVRKSRRGRQRKYKNNAEKQDAYRSRKYGPERRHLVFQILSRIPPEQGDEINRVRDRLSKSSIRRLREKLRLIKFREFRNKPIELRNLFFGDMSLT